MFVGSKSIIQPILYNEIYFVMFIVCMVQRMHNEKSFGRSNTGAKSFKSMESLYNWSSERS